MHQSLATRSLGVVSMLLLAACGDSGTTTTNTTVVSPVAVSAVFPAEARAGETITVRGQRFGATQGTSTISINGAAATQITSWSDTQIEATVPTGATTGNVTVTVGGVAGAPGHLVVPWSAQNPDNVAIGASVGNQAIPQITSDGSGGTIVVWQDSRNGTNAVYAQRVNSIGAVQWFADGVMVSAPTGSQDTPQVTGDGAGGAIVVWRDFRNGNTELYAQRLNDAGVPQWAAAGVAVSTVAGSKTNLRLIGDGAGGAIVVWEDDRLFRGGDIYAQRLDAAGAPQWAADGTVVCAQASPQLDPQLIGDGAGGAIVVWQDRRFFASDIYAQHINAAGALQWTVDGVAVSAAAGNQFTPRIVGDGAGGAILAWTDLRNGINNYDIYAQRLSAGGVPQWTADGVAVSAAPGIQTDPEIIADGTGGAILTWGDSRNGSSNYDIYAQRLNIVGTLLWAVDGVTLSLAVNNQGSVQVVSDGAGGAVVTWEDSRSGSRDIYTQRLDNTGTVRWAVDGIAISSAAGDQANPQIVLDGIGGAIVVWQDFRNGGDYDIYAQGITASGRQ